MGPKPPVAGLPGNPPGAGAAAVSELDRRTVGAQIDDVGGGLRAADQIRNRYGDAVRVNVTSFNRSVLLTGEVPDVKTRTEIEYIVIGIANVRSVSNDLQVAGVASLFSRASDATITGTVKARLADSRKLNPIHVTVITEASVVYLLGIVTEAEANVAVEVARTTGGVRKVVKVFEYCNVTHDVCRPR